MPYCELNNNYQTAYSDAVKIAVFGLIANTHAYGVRIEFDCSAIAKKLI